MIQKDLKQIHELLMENVKEENEKEKNEFSNSLFNLNTKNNLIAIAKEALKPKHVNHYKIKKNNNITPVKISKASLKKSCKISKQTENIKTNNILSDKKYLNLMLNDLKNISSSIQRRQNRFNPSYSNDNSILSNNKNRNKLKYNSYGVTKSKNIKTMNLKLNNKIQMQKYNKVNLLTQIIGENNSDENSKYENNNITESNSYFNNLCYDNNEKKIYVKETTNNYY